MQGRGVAYSVHSCIVCICFPFSRSVAPIFFVIMKLYYRTYLYSVMAVERFGFRTRTTV